MSISKFKFVSILNEFKSVLTKLAKSILKFYFRYYKNFYFYWRSQNVNGPFPIPIINDFYMYALDPMHDAHLKCLNKYGPIWCQFGFSTFQDVNVCDPELIRELLVKDFR